MNALFAPPEQAWQRISPAYAQVRRIHAAINVAVVTAMAATPLWLLLDRIWGIVAIVAGVGYYVWRWFQLKRWVEAWGYAEADDDLYLTHGLWFRRLLVIPYGRMQAVKVESGPITRMFGLASVELVTASVQSGATIPGLPQADAERLRDRLTALGIGDEDDL